MRLLAVICMSCLIASPAFALSCRSQLQLVCEKNECDVEQAPADLDLDFAKKQGSFCRGEQCDDGSLTFADPKGQWDERSYKTFALKSKAFPTVNGAIDMETKTFSANSEVGLLFGRCE